jgi:hypothetical protein
MKNTCTWILFLFILLFAFSCSNGKNPVIPPDIPGSIDHSETAMLPGEMVSSQRVTDDRAVWGIWKISVNVKNLTAEVEPVRRANAIGNVFDADLSQFLSVSPCSNCLIIPAVAFDGYDDLNMLIRMKHPFDDITKRPDLHGFDVRGIFITNAISSLTYGNIDVMLPGGATEPATLVETRYGLLNPDGLTSHYDSLVTDPRYFLGGTDLPGNLNPFLRFFEDYNTTPFDPASPSGHNVMAVGSHFYSRTAVFSSNLLNDGFVFYLVADVAYGQSATLANRTAPLYYLPWFNRTEPWRVEYWIENNNLSWVDPASQADVVVQVFDWQQGATIDPAFPDPAFLSGIPESSDVLRVELSVPGLQDDPVVVTAPESGSGTPSDPLQYRLAVTNAKTSNGNQTGLLAIRDELYGSAAPSGRMPIPPSPAGFPYETLDILDYTLYMPVQINMPDQFGLSFLPTYNANYEMTVPYENLFADSTANVFKPQFFMDQGHRLFEYSWDHDYDGITFDVDSTGLPSEPITFPRGGRFDIGFRVHTNSVPSQEYMYTLPVYSKGTTFKSTLENMSVVVDSASSRMGHAVAISNDKYYVVFEHEQGGNRDVWLSIADREGTFVTKNLANSSDDAYEPCLLVIEHGSVDDGIYVAYGSSNGSESHIYTIRGNLDGTGFSSPVRVSTGNPGIEIQPVLVYANNKLFCYYGNNLIMTQRTFGAHSNNMGDSWVNDGWIVDNTSSAQIYPTAAVSGGTVWLFWEDYLNTVTRGYDIWMAKSANGTTFTDLQILNTSLDDTDESQPSACYSDSQVVVSYLSSPRLTDDYRVRLAIIGAANNSITSYNLNTMNTAGLRHTAHSVGCSGPGKFLVAYSVQNVSTSELSQVIVEVNAYENTGSFYESILLNESMGTVSGSIYPLTYPCVASRTTNPYCSDYFVTWTNYTMGNAESTEFIYPKYFGRIERMAFVRDRTFVGWL